MPWNSEWVGLSVGKVKEDKNFNDYEEKEKEVFKNVVSLSYIELLVC